MNIFNKLMNNENKQILIILKNLNKKASQIQKTIKIDNEILDSHEFNEIRSFNQYDLKSNGNGLFLYYLIDNCSTMPHLRYYKKETIGSLYKTIKLQKEVKNGMIDYHYKEKKLNYIYFQHENYYLTLSEMNQWKPIINDGKNQIKIDTNQILQDLQEFQYEFEDLIKYNKLLTKISHHEINEKEIKWLCENLKNNQDTLLILALFSPEYLIPTWIKYIENREEFFCLSKKEALLDKIIAEVRDFDISFPTEFDEKMVKYCQSLKEDFQHNGIFNQTINMAILKENLEEALVVSSHVNKNKL